MYGQKLYSGSLIRNNFTKFFLGKGQEELSDFFGLIDHNDGLETDVGIFRYEVETAGHGSVTGELMEKGDDREILDYDGGHRLYSHVYWATRHPL
jgi:hypothetical protein